MSNIYPDLWFIQLTGKDWKKNEGGVFLKIATESV